MGFAKKERMLPVWPLTPFLDIWNDKEESSCVSVIVPDYHACEMSILKQKARGTFLAEMLEAVAGGRRPAI